MAQEVTANTDTTLTTADGPVAGVLVTDGATLTTSDLVIDQSDNAYGIKVDDGTADVSGGSITQQGTGKYVTGIGVFSGSATVDGTAIAIDGGNDASGLYVDGANASISGNDLDVSLTASGSTTADPAAAVQARHGSISTSDSSFAVTGDRVFGLLASGNAENATVFSKNDTITTNGEMGWGAFAYSDAAGTGSGSVQIEGGSIKTNGLYAYGLVAEYSGANIDAKNGLSIDTTGDTAIGAYADQATINLSDVDIVTHGLNGYGAYAYSGDGSESLVTLNGGSILTANDTGRGTQDGDGSRAYAVFAEGAGASVQADGTDIRTLGQRAYGAYAFDGGSVDLKDVTISTEGFMGYGLYAYGNGSVLTGTNVNVTTTGDVGDGGLAYDSGRLVLDGGSFHIRAGENSNEPHEPAVGLLAFGGASGSGDGVIDANNVVVTTEGANSIGVQVGGDVGADHTSGTMTLSNSNITANGLGSNAAEVESGSTLSVTNSSLVSTEGNAISLSNSADVTLNGAHIEAGQAAIVSELDRAGQTQTISIGDGTVATKNNGTLLQVERSGDGADGAVEVTLGDGSTTRGDIIDNDIKTSGYTDVTVGAKADFLGRLFGVRNLTSAAGSDVDFQDKAVINGDVQANGSTYTFSKEGGDIAGDVSLSNDSATHGGTIDNPINVGGDVSIDQSSYFGGNWNIQGDLDNAGTLSPGNSIGVVTLGGNLTLDSTSVYHVEVNEQGKSDRVNVGGTANLDGQVAVSPLDGFRINAPYTILTAGSLAGSTFDGVSWDGESIFVSPALSYDANDVFVTLTRNNVSFASVAQTGNQAATAEALDSLSAGGDLATSVAFLNASDARSAFDQLSGEGYASVKSGLIENSGLVRGAVLDRLHSAFASSLGGVRIPALAYGPEIVMAADAPVVFAPTKSSVAPTERFTAWGSAYGSWGETDGDGNAARLDRDTGGFVTGIDAPVALFDRGEFRVGIMGGYGRSDFDVASRGFSANVDSWHLGAYAGAEFGKLDFSLGVIHSWHDIDANRSVAFPGLAGRLSADYNAQTTQVFGEAGYRIDTRIATFEPFAGLAYVNLDTDGFGEDGGAAALHAFDDNTETTFSTIGVRIARAFDLGGVSARARGALGWRHAFGDRQPDTTFTFDASDAFTVSGVPIAEDAALVEAGLDFDLAQHASLGLSYQGQFGDDTTSNGGKVDLSVKF